MKSAFSKRAALVLSLSALLCASVAAVGARPQQALALTNDLSISKDDGVASVERGASTTYTIVVTNTDDANPVANAVVNDALPGLTGATWTCVAAGTGSCANASGSGSIVNELVTLDALGTATFTVTGTVTELTTSLANTATVDGPSGFTDADVLNNTATDADAVYDSVDLSITKTDGQTSINTGATATYTIVVTNNDTVDTATGAHVIDTVPAGLNAATWSCVAVGGTCGAGGSGSFDDVVDLGPLGAATYTVSGTVDLAAVGSLVNTATVNAPAVGVIDPNLANNSSTDTDRLGTIHLCARAGTTVLPNTASVAVWGYLPGDCTTATPVTQPGGPVISVTAGDQVTIVLHNSLPEATALLFQGQATPPDMVGAAAATGSKTYTFTATSPGTYLYEAGLTPNGQHHVAMGLYGAFIVRPAAAGQAYNGASTAYDDEGVLVLGEIDPVLNNATNANKLAFDMRNFKPRFFTINGKAYNATASIPTTAGNTVLLRYVNAGISYHSMSLLGGSQEIIAYDGNPLTYTHKVAAETFGPGQTTDALVHVPATTAGGSKLAIYDGNLLLNNNTASGFGGMLTFIDVGAGTGGDTAGPATSGVSATPNPTDGSVDVALAASVSDVATGGANVTAAEYRIDSGTSAAMSGTFGTPTVSVNATILAATVNGLTTGSHVISVRGQDSLGNWGAWNSTTLSVVRSDTAGPVTTGPSIAPSRTNGTANVALHATTSDATTGGATIAAGEYFIDTVGANGTGTAMTVNLPAVTASLDATILAATVNGLPDGSHTIYVHGMDNANNWGAAVTIGLVVDKTGPSMTAGTVYSNGVNGVNSSTPAARVSGTVTDLASNAVAAEGFIDTVGATGTGFLFVPTDGTWSSLSEAVSADIPLTTINSLTVGTHHLWLHGKDAAGNWGPLIDVLLLIDKTLPVMGAPTATVSPASPAATSTVTLTVAGTDNLAGAGRVEWFRGTDPGLGLGTAMTITGTTAWSATSGAIDVSTLPSGVYTFSVRARDNAMNWAAVRTVSVTVIRGSVWFSTSGNTNPTGLGGTADDADVFNWAGAFTRTVDVTAITGALPAGANVDGLDFTSPTSFCVSFNGNVVVPGIAGTVADEDVVCRNGTTWSMFFDGSARGLATGTFDLDEIAIVGDYTSGTLYFSTDNNSTPPGAVAGGDDADIYRWNGGLTYTRMVNANGATLGGLVSIGLPTGANVDGLAYVDATHFYLSFAGDVAVPTLGTVQDEDVVYYNAGTWSVWFDGTSLGMTNGNQDLDAIDV